MRQWYPMRLSPHVAMLGMAGLVGTGAGFGAVGFSWLVDAVTDLAFHRSGRFLAFLGPYYVIILPALGGVSSAPWSISSRGRPKDMESRK